MKIVTPPNFVPEPGPRLRHLRKYRRLKPRGLSRKEVAGSNSSISPVQHFLIAVVDTFLAGSLERFQVWRIIYLL